MQPLTYEERFVAVYLRVANRIYKRTLAASAALVAAHRNTRPKAAFLKLFNQPDHHGCFTRAAHSDVPYNNYRYVHPTGPVARLLLGAA